MSPSRTVVQCPSHSEVPIGVTCEPHSPRALSKQSTQTGSVFDYYHIANSFAALWEASSTSRAFGGLACHMRLCFGQNSKVLPFRGRSTDVSKHKQNHPDLL